MLPFQLTRFKAFILIILIILFAVACVSGYEKDAGSHDATMDRSSRLSSSRATARDTSSPGAPSASAAHGAAAAKNAAPSHGAAAQVQENKHGGAAVHWSYD